MAEKFNTQNLTNEAMAAQLRKPDGKDGKEVGKQMNKGNKHICLNTYKLLSPTASTRILEIGMGNGYFIKHLMSMSEDLTYTGLDFSQTMIDEATRINEQLMQRERVSFVHGSVEDLPFETESMDYVTSTNTLYFWPNPIENAKEIYRVLKKGGKLMLGFRSKKILDQIQLSQYGFKKYENPEVEDLLVAAGFKDVSTKVIPEPALDFDGKPIAMEGSYTMGIK